MPGPATICTICRAINCDQHRRTTEYDQRRGTAASRGYDATWREVRRAYLAAHPLCQHCERDGRTVIAMDVDHITPLTDGGARLDSTNLQSLCRSCHVKKTVAEQRGGGVGQISGRIAV